jgi:hypothetical protein
LPAFAIEGDGLALKRLDDEIARHPAVVGVHARAVAVEDARDLDVHPVLAAVIEEKCLGAALAFVVPRARADGIHLAPVAFRLRMHFQVAIDRTGGRLKDLRTGAFGQPQHIDRVMPLVLVVCTGSCW